MSIPDVPTMPHVVHLTSAHPRYDIRIFRKQCKSLVKAGFRVSLIVADGNGDETTDDGIAIYDVGKMQGRVNRIFRTTRRVFQKARELNADLYQLHDPELLPAGLKLRRLKKVVIFDSHEDVPKQMLGKPYLNPFALWVIAKVFSLYEAWVVRRLSAVIGATPVITEKFRTMTPRAENVNNFPELGELENQLPWTDKRNEVCYVGGIAEIRGILPLIEAISKTASGARLNLVGEFSETDTEAKARAMPSWQNVNAMGFLDRAGVRDVMARSVAGVVTFAPLPNHVDAQPNKMFEYMSAGIPVIASDFPLWREIIVGSDCGLCVDPAEPDAIASAIDTLLGDKALSERLGDNGKRAVEDIYNWAREEPKLTKLYRELLR